MLRVLETELVGYFADSELSGCQFGLGAVYQVLVDVVEGGDARLLAHQVAEVVGRQVYLVGQLLHSGQSLALWAARGEIVGEHGFKAGEDVMVLVLAGDELAVVEARGIVEQHLDSIDDELARVAVDGVAQFVADALEAALYQRTLLLRQMQRLVDFVVEEGVVLDGAGQRRALQQVPHGLYIMNGRKVIR